MAPGAVAFAAGRALAQSPLPVLAVLEPGPQIGFGAQAFIERLAELGWNDGRSIRVERYFASWDAGRLAAQAREAVAGAPRLVFTHSIPGVSAARAATSTVPIVALSADLVAEGFVASLAAPGGNITGVTTIQRELDAKRLELLHDALPDLRRAAFLAPSSIPAEHVAMVERAAAARGLALIVARIEALDAIESTIDSLADAGVEALVVQNSAALSRESERIARHALHKRLAAISESPRFAERGGLIQYGADIPGMFRQLAVQADKILRGARPGDLPIEQPARIVFFVNMRTAQTLGLRLPSVLLARADEVIE